MTSRSCRTPGACLLLLAAFLISPTSAAAQDTANQTAATQTTTNNFNNLTAKQLQDVAAAANKNKLRPTKIEARSVGREIRFQVEFGPNPDTIRWAIVINAPGTRIRAEDRKFQKQGYERTLTERARLGREILTTAVWTRAARPPEPLVLPADPTPSSGDIVPGFEPIDVYFTEFLKAHNAAGASVAVAYRGNLVYERAFGYSDVSTKTALQPTATMRIASLSKTITAVTILRLVQQRKLNLDDKIAPILADKAFRLPTDSDPRWNEISVRHLLQHSGGWDQSISGDASFEVVDITTEFKLKKSADIRHLIRYQMKKPLDFDPGSKTVYNNFGYLLLGRIIEAVSGQDYPVAVSNLLLNPAAMQHTVQSRTAIKLRQPNEPIYHMQTTNWLPPYWTGLLDFGRKDTIFADDVPEPYGRWKLEVMDSSGAWLATASDMIRFATSLDRIPAPLLADTTIQSMIAQPDWMPIENSNQWMGLGWSIWSPFRETPETLQHCRISLNGSLAGTSTVLSHRSDDWTYCVLFNTDQSQNGTELSTLINRHFLEVLGACTSPK